MAGGKTTLRQLLMMDGSGLGHIKTSRRGAGAIDSSSFDFNGLEMSWQH